MEPCKHSETQPHRSASTSGLVRDASAAPECLACVGIRGWPPLGGRVRSAVVCRVETVTLPGDIGFTVIVIIIQDLTFLFHCNVLLSLISIEELMN